MAKKIKKVVGYSGGRESTLSGLAGVYLFTGILWLILGVIVSGYWTKQSPYDSWAENGVSWFWIAGGITALFHGLVAFLVLKSVADTLRIVKKIAGMPHGGNIGGLAEPTERFVCSDCGRELIEEVPEDWEAVRALKAGDKMTKCPHCKVEFEGEE